jgi:hypothetical protein
MQCMILPNHPTEIFLSLFDVFLDNQIRWSPSRKELVTQSFLYEKIDFITSDSQNKNWCWYLLLSNSETITAFNSQRKNKNQFLELWQMRWKTKISQAISWRTELLLLLLFHLNKETQIVRLIALTHIADLKIALPTDLFCIYCHFLRQILSRIDFVYLSLSNKIFIKNFSITDLFPSHHLIRFFFTLPKEFSINKNFWIRWLYWSATNMFPERSKLKLNGLLNWFDW